MITRQYYSGCKWCNANGFVSTKDLGMNTTPLTEICPICNGSGVMLVTELIPVNEYSEPDHELLRTGT